MIIMILLILFLLIQPSTPLLLPLLPPLLSILHQYCTITTITTTTTTTTITIINNTNSYCKVYFSVHLSPPWHTIRWPQSLVTDWPSNLQLTSRLSLLPPSTLSYHHHHPFHTLPLSLPLLQVLLPPTITPVPVLEPLLVPAPPSFRLYITNSVKPLCLWIRQSLTDLPQRVHSLFLVLSKQWSCHNKKN